MEDPVLNRNLEETKELQTRWSQFHDFCLMAQQQGPAKITAQAEMKFLELKSRIAMLHDSFMSGLKHETKAGQNIMQIVSDVILLKRAANYSDAERQKFEFDWNDAYLLLTEQMGALEEEKKRLAGISKRAYAMSKRMDILRARVHKFFHSDQLRWAITTVIIIFAIYVVPAFFWSYRNLAAIKPIKPVYAKFVNMVYRPFLSSEYEYNDMEEVDVNAELVPGAGVESKSNSELTQDYFLNNVIPMLGVSPQNSPEVIKLITTHDNPQDRLITGSFSSERWFAEGKYDVQIYMIVFPSSQNAKRFVELVHQDVIKLNDTQRKFVLERFNILRRANFVVVGISEHVTKGWYVVDKFKFKKDSPNELAK